MTPENWDEIQQTLRERDLARNNERPLTPEKATRVVQRVAMGLSDRRSRILTKALEGCPAAKEKSAIAKGVLSTVRRKALKICQRRWTEPEKDYESTPPFGRSKCSIAKEQVAFTKAVLKTVRHAEHKACLRTRLTRNGRLVRHP